MEPIPTDHSAPTHNIVLYDLDCGFCRWMVSKLLAWDRGGTLRPVAIQDAEGQALLDGVPPAERLASWHLAEPGGEVTSGGAAFDPALRRLPGGRPLAALARRFPGGTERGYRWVVAHRSAFGRRLTTGAKRRADGRIAARGTSRRPPPRRDAGDL